jgi:hypothetical protein
MVRGINHDGQPIFPYFSQKYSVGTSKSHDVSTGSSHRIIATPTTAPTKRIIGGRLDLIC